MRRPNGGGRISNGGGGMKPCGIGGAGINGGGGIKPGRGGIIGEPGPPLPSICNGELAVPFNIPFSAPTPSTAPAFDIAVNFLRKTAASDRDSSRRRSVCLVANQLSCALFSSDNI